MSCLVNCTFRFLLNIFFKFMHKLPTTAPTAVTNSNENLFFSHFNIFMSNTKQILGKFIVYTIQKYICVVHTNIYLLFACLSYSSISVFVDYLCAFPFIYFKVLFVVLLPLIRFFFIAFTHGFLPHLKYV